MKNSKKIPKDMYADLQQQAKGLRRNRIAPDDFEQNLSKNTEQEQAMKNTPKQQVIERDGFMPNNTNEEEVLKRISEYASNHNVVNVNKPLSVGTFVTNTCIIDGQEVSTSYRIVEVLTSGGFGITYRVVLANHISEKSFVLKEFYPRGASRNPQDLHVILDLEDKDTLDALRSFYKEPGRVHDLIVQHYAPNSDEGWRSLNLVIPKTDTFEAYNNLYYVMDFVEGNSLCNYLISLSDYSLLSLADRLWIVKQLCNAVRNLHSIGCVHQDISPMNVMVNSENKRVVLIDYGLCTSLIKQGSRYSLVKEAGTPGFCDFYNFDIYRRNRNRLRLLDIYSLGAILAYICLEKKPREIKDFFPLDLCNHEEVYETDTLIEKKYKSIYNEIRNLVSSSIDFDLDKRIQTVELFEERLDAIIDKEKCFLDVVDSSKAVSTDEDELFSINDENVNQQVEADKQRQKEEERKKNEEKKKKEEERKKAEAEEQAQQKKRQEEADKKRNEETKRKIIKYVLGLLAGVLIISLVAWGVNEWKQRPILPESKPKVETPVVKAPISELDADAIISPSPVNENWMDEPLANLEKLNNDQMMAVLERAQQDLDFRHQLEHHCHRDLTILQLDQNGVPFKTTMLQLFMNNELGKEYEVSETEIVDNKLKRIILTKK